MKYAFARYILYSNHTDHKIVQNKEMLGQQQKHAQKKRNDDNGKLTKHRRFVTDVPSDFSYHAPSTLERPESSSTFKKGGTMNTALVPGPDGLRDSPDSE
jgi:hypothetical protein